jgi:hypothetical protein
LGNLKEGDDRGIGKMMIKYIFKELGVRSTDSSFVSRWERVVDSCEHGNETCSSMKDEFLD